MQYGTHCQPFTDYDCDFDVRYRYCVPMDNQRPELDLRHFKDICPDQNGMSSRAFLTVVNASIFSASHRGLHQVRSIPS